MISTKRPWKSHAVILDDSKGGGEACTGKPSALTSITHPCAAEFRSRSSGHIERSTTHVAQKEKTMSFVA
eukprot:6211222-Pleurochrysis_carterae.AAC.5